MKHLMTKCDYRHINKMCKFTYLIVYNICKCYIQNLPKYLLESVAIFFWSNLIYR